MTSLPSNFIQTMMSKFTRTSSRNNKPDISQYLMVKSALFLRLTKYKYFYHFDPSHFYHCFFFCLLRIIFVFFKFSFLASMKILLFFLSFSVSRTFFLLHYFSFIFALFSKAFYIYFLRFFFPFIPLLKISFIFLSLSLATQPCR